MKSLASKGNGNVQFMIELAAILRVAGDTNEANTVEKRIKNVMNEL